MGHYSSPQSHEFSPITGDPLGHFEGTGVPASISWTGDGNRISNPSFEESSLLPWIPDQYNAAAGSSETISRTAYDGRNSTQLALVSGNLTTNSYVTLQNDLGQAQVGFSSSLRLRAAFQLEQLTGTNVSDRAETRLSLKSSIGLVRTIHYVFASGSLLPANSATDAYISVGPALIDQWMTIDKNVFQDAANAFPSDYPTFDSVGQVTLAVYAQTQPGPENYDPHIKYWNYNTTLFQHWQSGLTVVYDTNNNGAYDPGEPILGGCVPSPCTIPPPGAPLFNDQRLFSFIDSNNNDVRDPGEAVIYDSFSVGGTTVSNNGVYDFYDTVVYADPLNPPAVGALMFKVLHNNTTALFDRIELYSATGGSEWVKNGGFNAGLTSWGVSPGFTPAFTPVLTPPQSAKGSITNGIIEMAQSIDGRPLIDSSTIFNASANIATMSGNSPSDMVDVWLGLVDSQYNPVSLYYVFKTGDGSIPTNRTDAVYLKANGFGTSNLNQWLNVSKNLSQEIGAINLPGYQLPYTVELVAIEVTAGAPSSTTTAYFDNMSLRTATHTGTAPSTFYALDGPNTNYLYTATVSQGSLHMELPHWETVLNITSPEGTKLSQSEYTNSTLTNCTLSPCIPNPRTVDIPDNTLFKHAPVGTWRIFMTSTNAITSVYAEDPVSHAPAPFLAVGSTVNFVSQSKDPSGQPLVGVAVNLTLWDPTTGIPVGSWPGISNAQGWVNVTAITLPLPGTSPGIYWLQATLLSLYPGLRIFQISVRNAVTVFLSLSSNQTSAGSSVTISGSVTQTDTSTPAAGVNVTISYRQAGNSQWTVLGIVKTDSSGKYSYTWNPPEGEYELMASTGDTQTAPAQSSRAQLLVGPAGFLQGLLWPIVIGAVAAAAAAALVVIFFGRRRAQASKGRPKAPSTSL